MSGDKLTQTEGSIRYDDVSIEWRSTGVRWTNSQNAYHMFTLLYLPLKNVTVALAMTWDYVEVSRKSRLVFVHVLQHASWLAHELPYYKHIIYIKHIINIMLN